MKNIKYYLRFAFTSLFLLLSVKHFAQQCGNCNVKPKVARYDLDVQVPQPELKGEKTKGWLEWMELFKLSGKASYALSQSSTGCITFTQPLDARSSDEKNEILKVGSTYTNIPPAGDVSVSGNYIITGYIKQQGDGYLMHMEIQSACSRKKVASSDVPFSLSSLPENSESIAFKAASQLSPLIEKIKKFELEERNQNQKFAIAGNDFDRIKITPAKTKLTAGQQTEFTLELKDCDGVALAGREIVFTESNVGDNIMPGTIGGTVTPGKVVTDAQGKAKATFKMTATAGKPAIINAHTLSQTYQNCQGVLFGDAQIDGLPVYKVTLSYLKTANEDFTANSDEDGVKLKAGEQKQENVAYSFSVVHYPETTKDGEQIIIMPQFDNEPEYQKANKGKSITLYNDGYSEYNITGKDLELVKSPFGAPPPKDEQRQRYFSNKPLPPSVSFIIKNNELVFFSGGVEFPEKEEGLSPVSSSFGIEKDNKTYFPVKPKKITDPNSPYKWMYEFEYQSKDGYSQEGKVFKAGRKEVETATVRIWKSF